LLRVARSGPAKVAEFSAKAGGILAVGSLPIVSGKIINSDYQAFVLLRVARSGPAKVAEFSAKAGGILAVGSLPIVS
ncbi:hypothetical protein CP990_28715, partial [Escherichia coli]